MSAEKETKRNKLAELADAAVLWLQDPLRLRVCVLAGIVLVGLGGIGMPLSSKITVLDLAIHDEAERANLIERYQYLNSRLKAYSKRLPKQGDTDWWTQNFFERTREAHLIVNAWGTGDAAGKIASSGSAQGLLVRIMAQGQYRDIVQFVSNLENSQDSIHISSIDLSRGTAKDPVSVRFAIDVFNQAQHVTGKKSGSNKKAPRSKNPQPPQPEKQDLKKGGAKDKTPPSLPSSKTPNAKSDGKEADDAP